MSLVRPAVGLHAAWLDCHREWGPGRHEDGFGLGAADDVRTASGFDAWVTRLLTDEDASVWSNGASRSGSRYRWIVDDGKVVGGIAARVGDSDYIRRNGHIGFGVRPSARGRGIAGWALSQMLPGLFEEAGLHRVLLVCRADNAASAATIERHGGRLETGSDPAVLRRYWIEAAVR